MGAIEKILGIPLEIKRNEYKNRECCILIALDDRNAFNSARWDQIMLALPNGSYLSDRNRVLRADVGEEASMVAYADDIAITVSSKDRNTLERAATRALQVVARILEDLGLSLGPEKSEVVAMVGSRRIQRLTVDIANLTVHPSQAVKYMGIWIDTDLRMTEHIRKTQEKVSRLVAPLTRITGNSRNIRGSNKRI